MSYKCEIIADSLSPQGHRLTTFKVTYPRIIHAEMCRHRILSRNSASSRAIPFSKMVKMVEEDPFIPIAWQSKHSGMQGTEYLDGESEQKLLVNKWLEARDLAVQQSKLLNNSNVTKQLCNRLLEPFLWHTEIISGTEWENFFKLRCPQYEFNDEYFNSKKDWSTERDRLELDWKYEYSQGRDFTIPNEPQNNIEWLQINKSQADIHIQAIAELMWDAYNESTLRQLKADEWHIPFGDNFDNKKLLEISSKDLGYNLGNKSWNKDIVTKYRIKIATARCARISYETLGDNPKIDYEADIRLHDMLLESGHMSPFEHCAKAMNDEEYQAFRKGEHEVDLIDNSENAYWHIEADSGDPGWCNNFKGFIQYRHFVEN